VIEPGFPRKAVTIRTIRGFVERGEKFASLTCYDATTARWLEKSGIPLLLVGDTAAEVILGFKRTVDMPLDFAIVLTAGVKRGAPNTMVMADMPFLSYHESDAQAIHNAGRFLTESNADIVKFEMDKSFGPLVEQLTRAGIPVCAHVGSKPQQAALSGGYGSSGRTAAEAGEIVADAVALERAGAVMLLVEAVPDEVTQRILDETKVPLIGIGAGTRCHGQILVLQDLLGMTEAPPRFAEAVAGMGPKITEAASQWMQRVSEGSIGGQRYVMDQDEAARFRNQFGNQT
jgi:3-methyl-2-oxobutanoate hydroxymethyltransferase